MNMHEIVDDLLRISDLLLEDMEYEASFHALASAAAAASGFFNIEALSECLLRAQARLAADKLSPPDILRNDRSPKRIWRPDYVALVSRIEDYYLPLARVAAKAVEKKD